MVSRVRWGSLLAAGLSELNANPFRPRRTADCRYHHQGHQVNKVGVVRLFIPGRFGPSVPLLVSGHTVVCYEPGELGGP